jgi:gamma-glutamyltranspeptidase/glutathione hydrolase
MRRVAISASSRPAADAAARVADAGGNAVDAAVAATITAMVSDPGIIGPGAGCFLTIWPPNSDPVVVDGYAAMPGLATGSIPASFGHRVHMEYGGGMDTLIGPESVAVPGVWAGLGDASDRFGALEWPELVAPAIDLTTSGFPLSGVSEAYLAYAHDAIYDHAADSFEALHHPDGSRMADGDLVTIDGLADSLRTIATEGPGSFYSGSIGDRLAGAMGEWGGSITRADLEAYRAVEREPILIELDGWQIATNPAPAIGGAVLAALILLARSEGVCDWSAESARRLATVERAVLGYRAGSLDGASDIDGAVATLLDSARMGDLGALASSPSTVHTSTVDTDGLACAVTTSAGYGSGMMIPGTGLWLNNSLGEVELFPKGMEMFGPGDRLASNMAPTVARGPHGGKIALGSPGASRITTSLAQVLLNYIVLEMSVTEAITHPRLHVEVFGGQPTIAYEPGLHVEAFDDFALRRFPDLSMYFGGVGLAMFDPASGLYEAADPRRTGATAVGGL